MICPQPKLLQSVALAKLALEGIKGVLLGKVVALTKPSLLFPLDLNGQSKVGQFDGSSLRLAGQQQVLGLSKKQYSVVD